VLGVQTSLVTQRSSDVSLTAQSPEVESAPGSSNDSSGGSVAGSQADSGIKRAPADRLNLCEAPLAEVAPSTLGLRLDVEFAPTASTGSDPVRGTVRLTNTATTPVSGTTGSTPAITMSRDGIVLWHSNGPVDSSARLVQLGPGESTEYDAFFVPVRCSVEDDLGPEFRPNLPSLPAGDYGLSAAIDFQPDATAEVSAPGLDLVTGPLAPITLG
jgi:hypothetical protein